PRVREVESRPHQPSLSTPSRRQLTGPPPGMITASPEVITAGAASALLVARSARRLHTSGGGYALLATSAARGAVFVVNGVRPARGRGSFRAAAPLAGPGGGMTRF